MESYSRYSFCLVPLTHSNKHSSIFLSVLYYILYIIIGWPTLGMNVWIYSCLHSVAVVNTVTKPSLHDLVPGHCWGNWGCGVEWVWSRGRLAEEHCWLDQTRSSVTFLTPRVTCPGVALATGDWALLHQVTDKRHDTDLLPGQSDELVSSAEVLFSDWAIIERARVFLSKTCVTKCVQPSTKPTWNVQSGPSG